jgi:hypothetical protein
MTHERWSRIKSLFHEALEHEPDQRAAFLARTATDDPMLVKEVLGLLAEDAKASGFLSESSPLHDAVETKPHDSPPSFQQRFVIERELGHGGMGRVLAAHDVKLGRNVAIKFLKPGIHDADALRRFEQEARAAGALNHPNIIVVYDVTEHQGEPCIVTELLEGRTLREVLSDGPLPPDQALDLAAQLADGLAAAHAKGVVHRDLKPENLFVSDSGRLKILDFGIAKLAESQTNRLQTEPGAARGTPLYMSPEQVRAEPADARSDVFSFGIVLYEMLIGTPPFRRANPAAIAHAILEDDPAPLPPSTLERAAAVVERCLRKDPAARYANAGELLAALRGTPRAAGGQRRRAMAIGAVAAAFAALAIGYLWTAARRAQSEAERKAAVAEVEHLVDLGRFVDVWRAVHAAFARWPGEPSLEQMIRATTNNVTIATDPPGAAVAFKAYDDVEGEWIPLGISPLKEVRAPLGMLRWRLSKTGFEPLEARLEVGAPAAATGRPDVNARPIHLRPVGVEPARMVFVPGEGQLTDYWIDQTEVTNRDFKGFVDRGGYEERRHWTGADPTRFLDRTGRPGPSTWELGAYPAGQEDYPVGGVSWFEAVAYCAAVGKSLPTVDHWRRAFGATYFSEVVTLGNFSGRGPESTRRLKDVGPFGTYGMAGNVKEWAWNEFEGQRSILGGAWNEPVYMATDDDTRPPLDRAETSGFRCIKESAPSARAVYAPLKDIARRDYSKEKPVDAATFEVFRRFYSYDPSPLDAKTERTEETEHWRRERVSFTAAYSGERVLANVLIPKNAAPPYQSVIWFPGSYARGLKRSDGDLPFSYYFDFLPRSGRALVYPAYKGTYERSFPVRTKSDRRDMIIQWSKDLGRTIDYLNSRGDFAKDKIAYYGFSMGAGSAVPAYALEPRLKTAVLLTAGFYKYKDYFLPEVDALNFVPRVTIPVLLLDGRYDFEFPVETSQKPFFQLLGTAPEHKRHVVFENAGHVPPRIEVIREVLDWLDRYLGPVEHRMQQASR